MAFVHSQNGKMKIPSIDDTLLHGSSKWIPQRERGKLCPPYFTKTEVQVQGGYVMCSKSPSWQMFESKIANFFDRALSALRSYFSTW
jgi:hypothetical protein